jgi:ubiquinone/menaquinone biosynthesis C-methylase UbiE
MTDHQEIYREQAMQYELLVSREDYQGNILRTLNELIPFAGRTVVEFGAGTGRLTSLLEPVARRIYAFDHSLHMLRTAAARLRSGLLAASDHRWMALRDGVADVTLSGWSVCYVVVDHPQTWQRELSLALNEMRRVTKPGGMLVLLETLGTGYEQPTPPEHLHAYYASLAERGFQRRWMRTDYCFKDRAEAESSARFFFGEEMIPKIREQGGNIILPECTGLWWLKT